MAMKTGFMTKTTRGLTAALVLTVGLLGILTENLLATNGYMPTSSSIAGNGTVGAGVADVPNAMGGISNPAGLAFTGAQTDAGLSFFMPSRQYTVTGAPGFLELGTFKSENNFFVIPSFGKTWKLKNDATLAFSFCGNGGMNTEYDNAVFGGSSPTGVNLEQMCLSTSYAFKPAPKHGFGVALLTPIQRFKAEGLENFGAYSSDPANLTNNGHETAFGIGYRLGYLGEVSDKLNFGITYMSDVKMSEFDDYAGLFAEQGDFDIPGGITIGVKYKINDAFKFLFDYQKINYGGVNSIANPLMPNLMDPLGLGSDNGAGFGWEDQNIYKFGLVWKKDDKLTYRIGYSLASQVIPESEVLFNILAPAVERKHAGFSVSKKLNEKKILHLALTRAFGESVEGPNPLDPGQDISLYMDQWKVSVGFTWKH